MEFANYRAKSICIVSMLALAACAGRAPQPVAVVQPQDRYMDCAAIQAEILANNRTIQGLGSEEGGKVAQNVAAGVAGLFIWPIWFTMDFQGTAGKEEAALQSRQEYLANLALQRDCGKPSRRTPPTITSPPALVPATAVQAVVPAQAVAPQPAFPMTPCGEDRPCSVQSTTAFEH